MVVRAVPVVIPARTVWTCAGRQRTRERRIYVSRPAFFSNRNLTEKGATGRNTHMTTARQAAAEGAVMSLDADHSNPWQHTRECKEPSLDEPATRRAIQACGL